MFLQSLSHLFSLFRLLFTSKRHRDTQAETFDPQSDVPKPDGYSNPPLPKEASFPVVVEMTIAATCSQESGNWTCALSAGSDRKELAGTDSLTTKDRLELAAAIAGLTALKRRCGVELYTESTYLLQAATLFPMWRIDPKHQMRNQALWDQLYTVASRHDIQWRGPRASHADEFGGVMTETTSEIQGRTQGACSDAGYLYAGSTSPWCNSLGEFQAFSDDEILAGSICAHIAADDMPPTVTVTKQARYAVIANVVKAATPTNPLNRTYTRSSDRYTLDEIAIMPIQLTPYTQPVPGEFGSLGALGGSPWPPQGADTANGSSGVLTPGAFRNPAAPPAPGAPIPGGFGSLGAITSQTGGAPFTYNRQG